MSQPWFKFSPQAWRGEQGLRAVSIAARGLWIECLCLMHEAKPYGHLVLNGTAIGDDTLARMTGVPVDEVSALMAELRQAGVLSVTGNGVVVSRRMVKDHERANVGRKSAKRRWGQVPVPAQQSGQPNGHPNGQPNAENEEGREPPKPPKGGERSGRRGGKKGASALLEQARRMQDGHEGSGQGVGGDSHDARRLPQLAIGDQ